MAKRVVQRYLLAAIAFGIALIWTGIGVTSGFECLLVFTLVYLGATVVQQRRGVVERRNGRARREPVARRGARGRAQRDPAPFDESGDGPQLAERW